MSVLSLMSPLTPALLPPNKESYQVSFQKSQCHASWKDLKKYASMNSEQVTAALKSSNYLTKWVD